MNTKKLGFYSSISTVALTLITFGIAIFTPPFSGPYCKAECFAYPYLDITLRFPRDYYWMYPAMLLMISYLVLMACIHFYNKEEKKIYSFIGLLFASMATLIFLLDFFIQVSVIQPSLLKGETDGVSLLTQFNPHGIFIVLEELGYLLMATAFVFMSLVFSGKGIKKAIKWTFISAFLLTIISFIGYLIAYGINREYRFEVVSISISWLVLIITGILLAILFKQKK